MYLRANTLDADEAYKPKNTARVKNETNANNSRLLLCIATHCEKKVSNILYGILRYLTIDLVGTS